MKLAAIERKLLRKLRDHDDVEMRLSSHEMALAKRMARHGLIGLSESGNWAGITVTGLDALDQEGKG